MKSKLIALSGGHNPDDVGATYEGFSEWPETRTWAELLLSELSKGYRVTLIAPSSLRDKVQTVNRMNADLAIEIHFNAGGTRKTRGCETLYHPKSERGRLLAECVQKELVAAMETRDRGVKEGWYRQDRPGAKDFEGDVDGDEVLDYWLRATACPAIIVEPEFVQHHAQITARRKVGAAAIARGVNAYFAALDAPKQEEGVSGEEPTAVEPSWEGT